MSKSLQKKQTPTRLKSSSPVRMRKNPGNVETELDKILGVAKEVRANKSKLNEPLQNNGVHPNKEEKRLDKIDLYENEPCLSKLEKQEIDNSPEIQLSPIFAQTKEEKILESASMPVKNLPGSLPEENTPAILPAVHNKYNSLDVQNDRSPTKLYVNTARSKMNSFSSKNLRPAKHIKAASISSEIESILTFSPGKSKVLKVGSPTKLPAAQVIKKYASNDILGLESFKNSKGSEIFNRNEPIIDQFYKIMNKPRPNIGSNKKEQRKDSPSKIADQADKSPCEDSSRKALIIHELEESAEVVTGLHSQRVLAKKFCKEFTDAIQRVSPDSYKLNLEATTKMFVALRFMKNNPSYRIFELETTLLAKYWKIVSINDEITSEKFLSSFLCICGIFPSQIFTDRAISIPEFLNTEAFLSVFTTEEELRFHRLFTTFRENRRILQIGNRDASPSSYSFRPVLNMESENLAKKKRDEIGGAGSLKRLDYFINEKKKLQESSEKSRQEKEIEEIKNCTFKPKILKRKEQSNEKQAEHRTLALYEKSKQTKDSQSKTSQDIVLEKDLSECTFAPNIKKNKVKEENSLVLQSKSVQQQLARLQKAREEEARKKAILDGASPRKFYQPEENSGKDAKELEPMPMLNLTELSNLLAPEHEIAASSEVANSSNRIN